MLHTVRLIAWPFLFAPGAFQQRKGERTDVNSVESVSTSRGAKPLDRGRPHRQSSLNRPLPPEHPEASAWIEENVAGEAHFFGTALLLEPRYVAALIRGMRDGGLQVP